MKLSGRRAKAFCARPDTGARGALLYGTEASLVALARQELVRALTGDEDLRLARLEPARAVREPAEIDVALRARGFFSGRPVLLIEGAGDALAGPLTEILKDIRAEDGFLVVTAGSLPTRSGLRKLFEAGEGLVALAFHGSGLEPRELEELLAAAGLRGKLTSDAVAELSAAAETLDRGALMQLTETIAVYMLGRDAPIGAPELRTLLPEAAETELDRLVSAVAEGRPEVVGTLITRLCASGVGPVTMLIAASRHFRLLLTVATAPEGISSALGRLKPPIFGTRRDALAGQARDWSAARLEAAARLLLQTDRRLRSPGERPDRALVERCLMRLAMMAESKRAG